LKFPKQILVLFSGVLLAAALGCRKEPAADATQPLEQSFQTATPEIKTAVERVNTSLKAHDYAEASRALAPVAMGQPLTEPQKQAVSLALQQINKAVYSNPGLDTKEMYELRNKMFKAVDSGHGSR
jgi:hypothetical protein